MIEPNSKKTPLVLIFIITAVLLSACGHAATPAPTPDMSAYSTAAVMTVEARYTQTAAAVPTETPEPDYSYFSPNEDGFDGFDEFYEDEFNDSGDADFIPQTVYYSSETDTMTDIYGAAVVQDEEKKEDKAAWQSQSPSDGTHIDAGAEFDITWNMLNTGTSTWTTGYRLRYFSGTNLSKPGKSYTLSSPVAPNAVGACSMDAIAPWQSGTYKMSVVLSNEEDVNFAIVDITIVVD